ncbi:MAG: presenilin family intramembrane aspartyl protease [Candidatus Diapherotrites archaeon]
MQKDVLAILLALFVASQMLGLTIADFFVRENIKATIVTDNPDDVINAFALFLYILIMTAFLLVLVSLFKLHGVTMLFEITALFATSLILFAIFLPEVAFVFVLIFVLLRVLFRENIFIKNISSLISTSVVGALIGVSLGVLPIVIFLIIICIYDYIAVFKTKHMVKIAEAVVRENTAFTFSLPSKEKIYQLGTGDLVIPLAFAAAVLRKAKITYSSPYYFMPPTLILFASILGLIITFFYLFQKKHALPAMPLQGLFMISVWLGMVLGGMPLI